MADKSDSVTALVGTTVRELRLRRKLSQEQLSGLAGLDRTFVNGIEGGAHTPSVVTLVKLAIALDVLPSALLKKLDKATLEAIDLR